MSRATCVTARPGKRPGQFIVELPPAWELRLRRVLRARLTAEVASIHGASLSKTERQQRLRARAQQMRTLICQFLGELVMADIVGREVALSTRTYYGPRRGNLREEVEAVLREMLPEVNGGGNGGPIRVVSAPQQRPRWR